MLWHLTIGISLGLVAGGAAAFLYSTSLRQRIRKLEIELAEAEAQLDDLRELNMSCLNHAGDVITRWLDYEESQENG